VDGIGSKAVLSAPWHAVPTQLTLALRPAPNPITTVIGSVYLNELALDLALQLQLAGVTPTPGYGLCSH